MLLCILASWISGHLATPLWNQTDKSQGFSGLDCGVCMCVRELVLMSHREIKQVEIQMPVLEKCVGVQLKVEAPVPSTIKYVPYFWRSRELGV